ncbi:MAG TPA: efflux RND transporter periplasmic adaptor subunit [Terriglobales bacterium]|jgi:RND family efflux transporter MFP subunit|nr:efflux RND transporter periplasmic adaptor subunit [Terriglobales bacterium]
MRSHRTKPFLILLTLAGMLAGCSSEKKAEPSAAPAVRDVQVQVIQPVSVPDWGATVGTVRAVQGSQLSSQIVATIVSIPVSAGMRVRQGQVLVLLDGAQAHAAVQQASASAAASQQQIAAADADYGLASSTLKRYQALYEKKSVSPHELDQVQAQERAAAARREMSRAGQAQAQAALSQARTAEGFTRIRAPFDGVVTAKYADVGTMATPGTPLVAVEDTRRYRLEVSVDESQIADVRLGDSVPVALDAFGGETMAGKVVQIVPAADPASRSFTVKVELPVDARLRSGFFGRAQFSHGRRQAILISRSAVIDRGQLQGVYVVGADRVANLRYVTLGNAAGAQVEVLSGLQAGDRVVLEPGARELDGRRIEARR